MIMAQAAELLRVKAQIKELEETKEMLIEDITHYVETSGEETLLFDVSEDDVIEVKKNYRLVDKLDKEQLSLEVQIPQDDMKTPYDFSKLTELGKIKPSDIQRHTHPTTSWSIKVTQKKKPKRKKSDV